MIRMLRNFVVASLLLPVALPLSAAQVSNVLPAKVQQSLKANKISANSLSVVALPLDGVGNGIIYNADVSVNPASTMKLVTTFAGLQLLGPEYRWLTSLYADGQPGPDGVINGNVYLRGRLEEVAASHGATLVAPPVRLCTDNGAMIAWAGIERLRQQLELSCSLVVAGGVGHGARVRRRPPLSPTRIPNRLPRFVRDARERPRSRFQPPHRAERRRDLVLRRQVARDGGATDRAVDPGGAAGAAAQTQGSACQGQASEEPQQHCEAPE